METPKQRAARIRKIRRLKQEELQRMWKANERDKIKIVVEAPEE